MLLLLLSIPRRVDRFVRASSSPASVAKVECEALADRDQAAFRRVSTGSRRVPSRGHDRLWRDSAQRESSRSDTLLLNTLALLDGALCKRAEIERG